MANLGIWSRVAINEDTIYETFYERALQQPVNLGLVFGEREEVPSAIIINK